MLNALHLEISCIGIFLLLIILFNQRQTAGVSILQRQFNNLIYATIAMLVIDSACWLLDGETFTHARGLKITSESLYYVFNILIPYLWIVYLEIALSKEQKATYRRLRILSVPLVLLTAFVLVNLHTQSIFVIDEHNVYHRNSGFYAFAVGAYLYLGYAGARAVIAGRRAAWKEEKRRYYLMAFFMVPPSIGGIIQTFIYGVSWIWVFVAVSIMLMYIDTLNRQISTDSLTGINNRRELTKYILRETREFVYSGNILSLIMMDVDNFKQVNDTYGHYYGDGVLVAVSDILKQSCKDTQAFLARFGGDEFCIVYPAKDTKAVEVMISGILRNVIQWNSRNSESVNIGLSIGYAVWRPDNSDTVDELYKRADQKMYQVKNEKKTR